MDDIRNYKLKYLNQINNLIFNLNYSLFRYIGFVISVIDAQLWERAEIAMRVSNRYVSCNVTYAHYYLPRAHVRMRDVKIQHNSPRPLISSNAASWIEHTKSGAAWRRDRHGSRNAYIDTCDRRETCGQAIHKPILFSRLTLVLVSMRAHLSPREGERGWECVGLPHTVCFGRSTPARGATLTTHQFTANGHQYW